ncbi:MAG: choloylglycine hydrolase family protein [Hungatella sp.]|nr:choloylglycine hydrolase family protein [Hungatella sp.]
MCTAFTLRSRQGETFFGRNMDFSYDIEPHLYIVPKNYEWDNALSREKIRDIYCFIGIGQELEGDLGFFDGVNEMGFAAAVLYFAGYAQYNTWQDSGAREQIASKDFLHYILGRCTDIDDLRELLKTISIVGLEDPVTQTVAPLHWIAVDRSGECVVIEQTERGMEVITNPIGVMSNSPDFRWHMTNLRNYMEASPYQSEEAVWGNVRLTPFGQAGGTQALPGGYTSPERFVRTAYLKSFIPTPQSRMEAVVSCFHVMESVSIPKGAVVTSKNSYDYTKYTAFINTATCEYFFKTYDNIQVGSASLFENCCQFPELVNLGGL